MAGIRVKDLFVFLRELMALCGNCNKHIGANIVAIRCVILKCRHIKIINRCALES